MLIFAVGGKREPRSKKWVDECSAPFINFGWQKIISKRRDMIFLWLAGLEDDAKKQKNKFRVAFYGCKSPGVFASTLD
jgi:hypothetical protein